MYLLGFPLTSQMVHSVSPLGAPCPSFLALQVPHRDLSSSPSSVYPLNTSCVFGALNTICTSLYPWCLRLCQLFPLPVPFRYFFLNHLYELSFSRPQPLFSPTSYFDPCPSLLHQQFSNFKPNAPHLKCQIPKIFPFPNHISFLSKASSLNISLTPWTC